MSKFCNAILAAVMGLLLPVSGPLSAQQTSNDEVEAWRALDSEFKQAIIDEIVAKRGVAGEIDNADDLIRSAEDIRDALRVSCDLSAACADEAGRATLGEVLRSLPAYDEQEGLRNAEIIRSMKRGYED